MDSSAQNLTGQCLERAAGRRGCRMATASLLAALAACHASGTRVAAPDRAPPPPAARPLDVSYDWHGLLIAPFGSVLKNVPLTLHEVLLFHDKAHGGADDEAAVGAECSAADAPAPRFLGATPDEYLLCFKQDRLFRVQATVRLSASDAPGAFDAACALWMKNAVPAMVNAAEPGGCQGEDGAIHFSGRLAEEADQGRRNLSVTLDGAPDPTAARP